jgi:uncharacterized phage infection (PIP) family protein YhgE
MRGQINRMLTLCGNLLTGSVRERIEALELRLDDLRAHSNQVESKLDYLITLIEAQREPLGPGIHQVSSGIDDLRSRVDELIGQTGALAENDEAVLQGTIHIVESIAKMRNGDTG